MVKRETLKVEGMSCASCALRIEKNLSALPGVKSAAVNFATEKAVVEYDDQMVNEEALEEAIKRLGYGIVKEAAPSKSKVDLKITGMSCASCAAKIEKKLSKIEGVFRASVNLATERATVEFDASRVKVGALIEAVEDLGYGAERAEEIPSDREKEAREREIGRLRRELVMAAVLSLPLVLAMILTVLRVEAFAFLHDWRLQLALATP